MKVSLFRICATSPYQSLSTFGEYQQLWAQSGLLHGIVPIPLLAAVSIALRKWEDRHLWHHMYCLSSSDLPSIISWHLLSGETVACDSTDQEVNQINSFKCYWMEQFNNQWNDFGHADVSKKLRNDNWKFAKAIHIQHSGFIYIRWVDRQNASNLKLKTF